MIPLPKVQSDRSFAGVFENVIFFIENEFHERERNDDVRGRYLLREISDI